MALVTKYIDDKPHRRKFMCNKAQLTFALFMIYSLAEQWHKLPAQVYQILNRTGILDNYIIGCYDSLHTLGRQYLVEDVTEFAREKGEDV